MSPSGVSSIFLLVVLMYMLDTSNAGYAEDCDATYPEQWCSMDGNTWHVLDDKRCVKATPTSLYFDEAKKHCRVLGGELVSLHNLEQNDRLLCYLFRLNRGERREFWIGAMRGYNGFYWVDGSGGMKFSRWAWNQPDNFLLLEHCVEMNYWDWGVWNDEFCNERRPSVCAKNK